MIMLNPVNNRGAGNRMATSVNTDPPSELITRIRYDILPEKVSLDADEGFSDGGHGTEMSLCVIGAAILV